MVLFYSIKLISNNEDYIGLGLNQKLTVFCFILVQHL